MVNMMHLKPSMKALILKGYPYHAVMVLFCFPKEFMYNKIQHYCFQYYELATKILK